MKEAKPSFQILLQCLVAGSLVWCASSCVPRRRRSRPCTLLLGQRIGGLLVVYCPILERGGTEVRIDMTVMVAGMVVETENN